MEILGDCIGPVYQEGNLRSYVISVDSLHVSLLAYDGILPVASCGCASTMGQLVELAWHTASTRDTRALVLLRLSGMPRGFASKVLMSGVLCNPVGLIVGPRLVVDIDTALPQGPAAML